jgi:hypothetical protein
MSDVAEDEVKFDAPAPRRTTKKTARKAKRAAAPEPKRTEPFPGLTRTACATACNAKGCVISGGTYCAHPTKGGLQAADMNNPAALRRIQDARDQLQVRLDPDRYK